MKQKERKGKEGKGKERKGNERKGKETQEKERKGKEGEETNQTKMKQNFGMFCIKRADY